MGAIAVRRSRSWFGRATVLGLGGLAIVCVLYLLLTVGRERLDGRDFRYLWLAGHLWLQGVNPYGADFMLRGREMFPHGEPPMFVWTYPPSMWPISALVALIEPNAAFALWKLVTCAAVIAVLVCGAATLPAGKLRLHAGLLILAYGCSLTATSGALRTGQPTSLVLCGAALMCAGIHRRSTAIMAVGSALAMLKPQLGIPICVALLFAQGGARALLLGAALSLVTAIPAAAPWIAAPAGEPLLGDPTAAYQSFHYNTPAAMTGLPHLIWRSTGIAMPLLATVAMATSAVVAACVLDRRTTREPISSQHFALIATTATIFFVNLHTYDLMIVVIALPAIAVLQGTGRILAIAGLALLWRLENVVSLIAPGGSLMQSVATVASVATLLIVVGSATDLLRQPAERRRATR